VQSPHTKIIADAAKRNLSPIGLTRKGRSRIWLDDRGWYVTVVEFQPSGLSKGSYLNVGAHFLWVWSEGISFDFGYRLNGFVAFEANESFVAEIEQLAVAAAKEVERLRSVLVNTAIVAEIVPPNPHPTSWSTYHKAMSLALSSVTNEATALFTGLAKPAFEWCHTESGRSHEIERAAKCKVLARKLRDPVSFRAAIIELIAAHRKSLHLNERTDLGI